MSLVRVGLPGILGTRPGVSSEGRTSLVYLGLDPGVSSEGRTPWYTWD